MKTTIDKAGRVVIPAPIRQRAGLVEGYRILATTSFHLGNFPRALNWLELLKKYSPHPQDAEKWIADIKLKAAK